MTFLKNVPNRGRRGAAMVEMGILLALLCLITFGIIEYGWMFYRVSQVNLASRHGVRAGVRPAATVAEVEAAVASIMSSAGWDTDDYDVTTDGVVNVAGLPVTVRVDIDYDQVGFGLLPGFLTPDALGATATMAKEGQWPSGTGGS